MATIATKPRAKTARRIAFNATEFLASQLDPVPTMRGASEKVAAKVIRKMRIPIPKYRLPVVM
jgi:hypothetical protein